MSPTLYFYMYHRFSYTGPTQVLHHITRGRIICQIILPKCKNSITNGKHGHSEYSESAPLVPPGFGKYSFSLCLLAQRVMAAAGKFGLIGIPLAHDTDLLL